MSHWEDIVYHFFVFVDTLKNFAKSEYQELYDQLKIESQLKYFYKPPRDKLLETKELTRNRQQTEEKKYLFNFDKIYWSFEYDEVLSFLD